MPDSTKRIDRVVWVDRGWLPCAVGLCPSEDAWNHMRKKLRYGGAYPMAAATLGGHTTWMRNDDTGESAIVVCINDGGTRTAHDIILTIVHEAVHVWQYACRHMGETEPGLEMEAYGIQHITSELLAAFCHTQGKGRDWLKDAS